MAGKTLRVLARGSASVPFHSAHRRGLARFVGRRDDFELGTPCKIADDDGSLTDGVMPARVCIAEPTVIVQDDDRDEFTEQMLHLRCGDLWPFDEETARIAGVPFDPEYGGEYAKADGGKLTNVAYDKAISERKEKAAKAAKDAPAPAPTAPPTTKPKMQPTTATSGQEK